MSIQRDTGPGALHHVMNRGVGGQRLFLEEDDYRAFLGIMRAALKKFDFLLHVFCLMPNHFHLLLEMGDASISKVMLFVETAFAMYFNGKYDRWGHVFHGRYKSPRIKDESYYWNVARYIDMNPVRAGLASHPREWAWGSHRDLIAGRSGFISAERVLRHFADDTIAAPAAYLEFLGQLSDRADFEIARGLFDRKELPTMEPMATAFALRLLGEILARHGQGRGAQRDGFVAEAREAGFSNPEIAEFLGVSRKTIWESERRIAAEA